MLKTEIVSELGENPLLLPAYVEQALQANNRIKYLFTLLQEARRYADHPETGATDLRTERLAADISDSSLDSIIANSQCTSSKNYFIPHIALLHDQIVTALKNMLAPIRVGFGEKMSRQYEQRLETLLDQTPDFSGDEVNADYIERATHGRRDNSDSLHLLVMDLHKLINKLQADLAQETIDGAKAYAIHDKDRIMIKAFMKGLNSTAPLKFDHPGLDTTATRSGDKLIIENDIGTTDAHVLVIHVSNSCVTLTYTDVHERRATFFESLFETYNVDWKDTLTRDLKKPDEKERYYLCVGNFNASSEAEILDYLTFLGSRIVYLIDWNKARKRLRNFIKKRDCLNLLKWSADNNHGHRAFLQIGGERIIYEALGQLSRTEAHYGDRLDELLGTEHAIDFLKFVLQTTADGLLNGRSERLIRDEIKAEIVNYFQSAQEGIYEVCADHAACIFDLADAVRNVLSQVNGSFDRDQIARVAVLAKRWETRADELLNRVREITHRSNNGMQFRRLTEQADDVADSLEETAYLLTLLPSEPLSQNLTQPLQTLSNLLVDGVRAYIRCIETAHQLEESNMREDRQDFLETVDDIIIVEHQTDAEERRLLTLLIQQNTDSTQMHLLSLLAQSFEEAADALARSALTMKDYVINEVITP
jgi:uncharacterized protein Yka (UPF0111/DUF47 family)